MNLDLIFFLGVIFFPFIPKITKGKFEFIDIIILFYLWIDITVLFVRQSIIYIYLVYSIILFYSINFFLTRARSYTGYFRPVRNLIFSFLGIFFFFPFFQGANINQSTRFFSTTYTSIILLPLALFYFSKKGEIKTLLRFGYYFILIWCAFVIYATLFKLGGFDSERIGGTFFYFGKVAIRGGITYISFALLLVPLIYNHLKKKEKIVLLLCVVFIFATFLATLKRFVFILIALAVLNYLRKSKIRFQTKVGVVTAMAILIIILPSNPTIRNTMTERYEERGAEWKYSYEAVESDIRIDEPLISFDYMKNRGLNDILIGIDTNVEIDINYNQYKGERAIHNEFAMLFLKFGVIGVLLYITIFTLLYRKTLKLKKILDRMDFDVDDYWIVFQNLILIFLVEGMVGGHSHITFRGLVLVYSGAIAGYFYNLVKSNSRKNA